MNKTFELHQEKDLMSSSRVRKTWGDPMGGRMMETPCTLHQVLALISRNYYRKDGGLVKWG